MLPPWRSLPSGSFSCWKAGGVPSRNTPQFAVSAAKEGGGSSEEGRRPPSGRDPSLRKCMLTCTGQGLRLQ